MSFVNSYKPPVLQIITEPSEVFDVNFNAPVPERLESARVRLEPFIPFIHAKSFYNEYQKTRLELEEYLPIQWPDYTTFLTWTQHYLFSDPKSILFAIIDRTRGNDGTSLDESISGLIGFTNSAPSNLSTEVGPVVILTRAQRTFVSSNAIGLVLKYALDIPEDGGLGLRRVVWTANPNNEASVRAAQRMGFTIEGVARWTWVLPVGKDGGKTPVDGKRGEGQGRDSTVLSLCWDDWEGGVKERTQQMIDRV